MQSSIRTSRSEQRPFAVPRSTFQNEVGYEIDMERSHSIFPGYNSDPDLQRRGLREKMQEMRQGADNGRNCQRLSVRAGAIRDRVAGGYCKDQTQKHKG